MDRGTASILPILREPGPFNEVPEDFSCEDALAALKTSRILVIGAGGLGCEILKNLAMTGFKKIDVIDMDTIDVSNLNRQFLFREKDVGQPKALVAADFVKERMEDPELRIDPYFGTIQSKSLDYYKDFEVVICGLDSVEARRWINATLVELAEKDVLIPMVDGGTEGFRGQSRIILPTISSCFECTLGLITPKTTYPVCTIANTPRLPEHCIEWASQIEWQRVRGSEKFDADIPEHVEWMYKTALEWANNHNISGVTRQLTLGVVKNIIPAIASTNAIVAASCCNEAFKIVTNSNPILNNYMMYSGDESIYTYSYENQKAKDCAVCGHDVREIAVPKWWLLKDFIDDLSERKDVRMVNPSLASKTTNLYLRSPPNLEAVTRINLEKRLSALIEAGDEVLVTDPNLPISLRVKVNFV